MTTFGERLKELRSERGLTLSQMADKFHKTKASFSAYENDKRKPDMDLISDIADYFGVSVDYLLGRSGMKNDPYGKVKDALEDDPELMEFWDEMHKRDDIKLMFKQTKNMSPESVKSVVQFMKSVEDEHKKNF